MDLAELANAPANRTLHKHKTFAAEPYAKEHWVMPTGVTRLLKIMEEFQLEWQISYGKEKLCLLEKHTGWQSIEGCEQWDLTNLQTTARHSDLRLFQKESLDKLVSVTLNMLNEWFFFAAGGVSFDDQLPSC